MSGIQLTILAVSLLTALACAVPGVFLVLRKASLLSDGISHSILPGILLGYLVVQNRANPLLILFAAAAGLVLVVLVEALEKTRLVKGDAPLGLVFPALFSLGIIGIQQNFANAHIHTNTVLLGDLALAPLNRLRLLGMDLGPVSLYVMGTMLVLNLSMVWLFYKELKLSTFDPALAKALGFRPGFIHYGFMILMSITAVGAFDTAGSILVVALMVAPPAAALLVSRRLSRVLFWSMGFAALAAVSGFFLAQALDSVPSAAMALMSGLIFLATLVLAPQRGLLSKARNRRNLRLRFHLQVLLAHLLHHQGSQDEERECHRDQLVDHLQWPLRLIQQVTDKALEDGLVRMEGKILKLSETGLEVAQHAMEDRAGALEGPGSL